MHAFPVELSTHWVLERVKEKRKRKESQETDHCYADLQAALVFTARKKEKNVLAKKELKDKACLLLAFDPDFFSQNVSRFTFAYFVLIIEFFYP